MVYLQQARPDVTMGVATGAAQEPARKRYKMKFRIGDPISALKQEPSFEGFWTICCMGPVKRIDGARYVLGEPPFHSHREDEVFPGDGADVEADFRNHGTRRILPGSAEPRPVFEP